MSNAIQVYQVWQVFAQFRRIAFKRPMFLHVWHHYMDNFQGALTQGPFRKLLEVCGLLRWTIDVPSLLDQDGLRLNWLDMEESNLYDRVKDAWIWKVCREVQTRKDMQGLAGLDWRALQQARHRKAPPHHRPALARLRDGTFVEPAQHAKYDLGKTTLSPLCQQPDSIEHRCVGCHMRQQIYLEHQTILQKWSDTCQEDSLAALREPFLDELQNSRRVDS